MKLYAGWGDHVIHRTEMVSPHPTNHLFTTHGRRKSGQTNWYKTRVARTDSGRTHLRCLPQTCVRCSGKSLAARQCTGGIDPRPRSRGTQRTNYLMRAHYV